MSPYLLLIDKYLEIISEGSKTKNMLSQVWEVTVNSEQLLFLQK